ncbi:transcriptional regulator [Streptomonospora sp. S1-112]|uniref:Transcriptional regulator n=1 Tax=Streptomonospora mangrovi TaxID=2883123 RepID=A0A9X3NK87_9ACTN|nr:transcriptional regulator [Streptomonospora mangrovi]MDA0564833.1 transcriptional regulator [Streptomonospora mangrovi]
MPRPVGNTRLKAARQHAGYASQQALADAMTAAAPLLGIRNMQVSARQVRRWESANPPWPRGDHQRLLVHLLQLPVEELGFSSPWSKSDSHEAASSSPPAPYTASSSQGPAMPLPRGSTAVQPPTAGTDFATINAAYRRLYFTVQPAQLHPAVVEHTRLGTQLLAETTGVPRRILAAALAESLLLAGRIEFFDLQQPEEADATYVRALQAAGEADDPLMGSAILAHAAFIPGWGGDREKAAERMRAARTYMRRGQPSGEFLAWLDAVEAECETMCGHAKEALRLINHAETVLSENSGQPSPEWFNWFSPTRLAAFKGNTQLKAGQPAQAKATLRAVLETIGAESTKQRSVILGDLAAVAVAQKNPEEACAYADQALDQLSTAWYATGMDRITEVRRSLQPWADTECVRRLDDRLYGWETTLSTLRR